MTARNTGSGQADGMLLNARALLTPRGLTRAAFLVALVATTGSLYFSLGMGLYPCRLCWYQRILMYPQVVVLGVALVDEVPVEKISLPMASLGLGIAAYHSLIQITGGGLCGAFACSTVQFRLFGVFTIPNLSAIAFTLLLVILGARYISN